jgi:hypothetical protein
MIKLLKNTVLTSFQKVSGWPNKAIRKYNATSNLRCSRTKIKGQFAMTKICNILKLDDNHSYTWKEFLSQVLLDNGWMFL